MITACTFTEDGKDIIEGIELRNSKSNGFGWSMHEVWLIKDSGTFVQFEDHIADLYCGSPIKYVARFNQHRRRAKQSGIEFILTYEEWLQIWEDSGFLEKRGCYNKYNLGKKHSDETKALISVTSKGRKPFLGHKHILESRQRMSLSQKGKKHKIKQKEEMHA
jgi:hypothetical protein